MVTMETHLAELARMREEAIAHGQISAAVQAEHYRGKASGLDQDRLRLAGGPNDAGVGCSDPRAASFNPENRPKDQGQQKDRYDKRDHSNLL